MTDLFPFLILAAVSVAIWRPGLGIALALALGRTPFPSRDSPWVFAAAALVIAVVSSPLIERNIRRPPLSRRLVIALAVTVTYGALVAVVSSAATQYASEKAMAVLFIVTPLALIIRRLKPRDLRDFELGLVGVAVLLATLAVAIPGENGRAAALGGGPIVLAQLCGIGAILLTSDLMNPVKVGLASSRLGRIGSVLLIVALLLAALQTGSRMPVAALVLSMPLAGRRPLGKLNSLRPSPTIGSKAKRVATMAVGLTAMGSIVISQVLTEGSRFALLQNPIAELERSRSDPWSTGLEVALDNLPLGTGIGGYEAIDPHFRYPHNLFLELVAEMGVIGGAFGLLALIYTIRAFRAGPRKYSTLVVYTLLTVQFSGDLYNSRYFFVFLSLALSYMARGSAEPGRPPTAIARGGIAMRTRHVPQPAQREEPVIGNPR